MFMSTLSQVRTQIQNLQSSLPKGVQLVAVSKYHEASSIQEAYEAGQRVFGESHVQELRQKVDVLPQDIQWHFIGHLQTNKVKYIAPYISLIHSVDSERLLAEIDKQAQRCNRIIDVLLELHVAQEDTKSGLTPDECRQLLVSGIKERYQNVRICGLMTMASFVDDEVQIAKEFDTASQFFDEVKQQYFPTDNYFSHRSWGMSDDYPIAIEHNSNMVRIGTLIFGERSY